MGRYLRTEERAPTTAEKYLCDVERFALWLDGEAVTREAVTGWKEHLLSVTASPKIASKGTTVTITVKPDKGYEVDEIIVTDKSGDELKVTRKSDTRYTFTMPSGKVTVEAGFVEIEDAPDEGLAFVDVPANAYYADAVAWAVENGNISGTSDTTFSSNAACTRGQIVTFLYRDMA